jgi:hypothetical protein
MATTKIMEHASLRNAQNLAAAKKAFEKGFSTGKGNWNYTKIIGDLAFWVEEKKDAYVNPETYGSSHVHSLGSAGYYGISLHPGGDKSYDARAVFKILKQGTPRYYLWIYAIALHNGNDIGGYQCFPKVTGGTTTFHWVHVTEGAKDGYHFATVPEG